MIRLDARISRRDAFITRLTLDQWISRIIAPPEEKMMARAPREAYNCTKVGTRIDCRLRIHIYVCVFKIKAFCVRRLKYIDFFAIKRHAATFGGLI